MNAERVPLTPQQRSVEEVIAAVGRYYNVPVPDILGRSRHKSTALARHVAIYMVRKLLDKSFNELAIVFKHKDHSTAMHSYYLVKGALLTDERLWCDAVSIERILAQ